MGGGNQKITEDYKGGGGAQTPKNGLRNMRSPRGVLAYP